MTEPSAPPMKLGRLAAAIAAAGLLLSFAASAQTVRREVDGNQTQAQLQAQADAQQDRIEELQSQLAAATAENESLQHQLMDARREIQRLQGMVGNLASVNQDLSSGQQPQSPDAAPPPAPPPPGGGGGGQAALSGGPQTGQLGTLPASQAPGDAGDAYSQALDRLKNGEYAQAEAEFHDLLENFPNAAADITNGARFWYAFTLLARHNDQDAAQNFIRYLRDAPHSDRAPEAQVRLGQAFAEMGQTPQACTFFTNLPQSYPRAPANIRSLAASEAARNHCR